VQRLRDNEQVAIGMLRRHYLKQRTRSCPQLSRTGQVSGKPPTDYSRSRHTFGRLNVDAEKNIPLLHENLTRTPFYWLEPEEAPAVTERLEKLVGQVEDALPNVLGLTNLLTTVLSNTASLTSN